MRFFEWLFGWREIRCEGEAAKRLNDYLLSEKIPASFDTDGGTTVVRVGSFEAKRIVRQLGEDHNAASVGAVRGLPARLLSIVRRPGVVLGVLLACFLLFFSRTRIWEIRVTGDGSIDEDEIRSVLFAAGLKPGMAIRDLSCEEIATKCLLREDLFSGINVSRTGVVAAVEWTPRRGEDPIPSNAASGGANLVASCDGVIVSVEPTSGVAVVKVGQTVHKGDLLISGVSKGGTVMAAGVVMAKVTEEFSASVAKTVEQKTSVRSKPVSLSFRMFGEELFSLGAGGDSAVIQDLTLPGGVVLPFSLRVGYARKTETKTIELSEAEAASAALRRLGWMIREALTEGELLKKEVTGAFSGNGYTATARTEYLINIAKPLAFDARNEYNK